MSEETIAAVPMPAKFGIGFMSQKPLPEAMAKGYRVEVVGRYHNYHVTPEKWQCMWVPPNSEKSYLIDGFSPNLNKELHVGHLRNLAVAHSLSRILPSAKFIALLGCSLGVKKSALQGWNRWTNFVYYKPLVYHDLTLPQDVIETVQLTDEEILQLVKDKNLQDANERVAEMNDLKAAKFWRGPNGPIMVIRPDGRPLYAFYDLLLAKEVALTHYITGHEQREHFTNLGLAEKHLPMGLILGTDGKKLKSRDGNAMSANEALDMVIDALKTPENSQSKQIAWNILAWNFLHAARGTDLKFEVEKWIRPESAGMYITYTFARVLRALDYFSPTIYSLSDEKLTQADADLLGLSEQYLYYHAMAVKKLDPAPIANFASDLARAIGKAYETEQIKGGREEFGGVMRHALWRLGHCMSDLGMFVVRKV